MASERAMQAAMEAHRAAGDLSWDCVLDAAFPVMLREAIEGMTREQMFTLWQGLAESGGFEDNREVCRAALLRAFGVAP